MAKALAYSIKRWEKLSLNASTRHLQLDNNAVERCMRSVAVGKKTIYSAAVMTQLPGLGYYTLYWQPVN
ncbi:hypothetical protein DXN04_33625 [Chitinophaga silvisoli]|uniref:Transposase IS66 central domain-containing protein n=1 Tax=Chitinophaga silvisoli TaxID=2291814 RepID=A0A3E1NMW4_9BACT|nr:hypothetical protein DXN04_33625 [Chitinophaga silvisoli]